MSFTVTKIQIENPSRTFEEDFKNSLIRLESISSFFLTNCVCFLEIQSGTLYLSQLKCHHEFAENDAPKVVDFNTVVLHKTYIDGLIEDDKRVDLNWDSVEIIVPNELLIKYYEIGFDSIKLLFEKGKISKISRVRIYPEFDMESPF